VMINGYRTVVARVSKFLKKRRRIIIIILCQFCCTVVSAGVTEKLFSMISTAFRKAVRMMCGVRWGQVIKHRITTNSLLERLGLKPIRQYIDSRILRWTGL